MPDRLHLRKLAGRFGGFLGSGCIGDTFARNRLKIDGCLAGSETQKQVHLLIRISQPVDSVSSLIDNHPIDEQLDRFVRASHHREHSTGESFNLKLTRLVYLWQLQISAANARMI